LPSHRRLTYAILRENQKDEAHQKKIQKKDILFVRKIRKWINLVRLELQDDTVY
jgi:hypothetical protein